MRRPSSQDGSAIWRRSRRKRTSATQPVRQPVGKSAAAQRGSVLKPRIGSSHFASNYEAKSKPTILPPQEIGITLALSPRDFRRLGTVGRIRVAGRHEKDFALSKGRRPTEREWKEPIRTSEGPQRADRAGARKPLGQGGTRRSTTHRSPHSQEATIPQHCSPAASIVNGSVQTFDTFKSGAASSGQTSEPNGRSVRFAR